MGLGPHLTDGVFMRGFAQESTSRHLLMALASRRLMGQLDKFSTTGEISEPMDASLKDLLEIMESDWQTNNSFAPLPGESPFARYDQALVVNEFGSQQLRDKLSCIVNRTVQDEDRGATVRDINAFLYRIEKRALYRYNEQPARREF